MSLTNDELRRLAEACGARVTNDMWFRPVDPKYRWELDTFEFPLPPNELIIDRLHEAVEQKFPRATPRQVGLMTMVRLDDYGFKEKGNRYEAAARALLAAMEDSNE